MTVLRIRCDRPTRRGATLALLAALAAPGTAAAQQQATTATTTTMAGGPADEPTQIVVTARKREEAITDVPLAISVFSQARLAQIGASNLVDVAQFSPGLFFSEQGLLRPGRADTSVRFRGMSVNTNNPQEQLASVFLDGVYVASGVQSLGFEDVERVEVIKGPQSGLFGRSTFGGAINIVTRKPGDEFRGAVDAKLASYGNYEAKGSIEGPIVPGVLSARIFARYLNKDGQYDNPAGGDKLGAETTKSVGGTIRLHPGNFEAIGRVYYAQDRDGAPAAFSAGVLEHNCGPFGSGTRRTICGDLPSIDRARIGQNTDSFGSVNRWLVQNVNNSVFMLSPLDEYGLHRDTIRGSLSMSLDIPSAGIVLKSVTGINNEKKRILADGDFSPDRIYIQFYTAKFTDVSSEFRVQSLEHGRIDWSVGGNWIRQSYEEQVTGIYDAFANPSNYRPACSLAPVACNPATLINNNPAGDLYLGVNPFLSGKVETRSLFGSADVEVVPTLSVSGELRRQWDQVDAGRTTVGTHLIHTFASTLYRGIVTWKPAPALTLYAQAAHSNLPGGYNASVIDAAPSSIPILVAANAPGTLPEQTLMSYEIGFKGRLLDDRVTFAVAAYTMDWKDQRLRRTAFNPTLNRTITYFDTAGKSELRGLELEGAWNAAGWLRLEATADYSRAVYQNFISQLMTQITGDANASGKSLPSFPKYSATASATVTQPWGSDRLWYARADFIYRGKIYVDETNLTTVPSNRLVNLRSGVTIGNATAELFVTNVFNSKKYLFAAQQADISAYKYALDLTQPGFVISLPEKRTVGVSLRTRF